MVLGTIEHEATIEQLRAADRAWESNCRAVEDGPGLFRVFGVTRASFTAEYLRNVYDMEEL